MTVRADRRLYSASEVVRAGLRAWAEELVRDIVPATIVVGELEGPGEAYELPVLGLAWGQASEVDATPFDEETLPDGRGVWRLHFEEVDGAFIWHGTTPEEADYFAAEFGRRATHAARRSNRLGSRVLHFAVETDGIVRTAKLYLDGRIVPESPQDGALRGLYRYRVPFTVAYPVMAVETPAERTGLMRIVVNVAGVATAIDSVISPP